MLFEQSFFADFKYWVRGYEPETGTSHISNMFNQKWEYYEEDPNGEFESIFRPDLRYSVRYGKSQEAKMNQSPISPVDLIPRDHFKGQYNHKPRIMYLDIETHVGTVIPGFPVPSKALEPISLIQFQDSETSTIHLIGDREFYYQDWYEKQPNHKGLKIFYHKGKNEVDMLEIFFEFLNKLKPAVVYAWNGEGFDFPYLFKRADRLGLNVNKFSPFWDNFKDKVELVKLREDIIEDRYYANIQAAGIYYIDLKKLYQKIVLTPRASYALNSIAEIEVKAEKVEHTEFRSFEDFYLGNYVKPRNPSAKQKTTLCYQLAESGASEMEIRKAGHGQFLYYGVIDVVLLRDIDEKKGLSKLMTVNCEDSLSNFDSILRTTKPWGNKIRNTLFWEKRIITDHIEVDLEKQIKGGFVREPQMGMQKWVVSEDVNSMYPILAIQGSNMSPETFRFAYQVPEDLKRWAIENLHVGTSREQDEENLLNLVLHHPKKIEELKAMLKKYNLSMAPNGVFFDKTKQGIVPRLVAQIYKERKSIKKEMFRYEQAAVLVEERLHHLETAK